MSVVMPAKTDAKAAEKAKKPAVPGMWMGGGMLPDKFDPESEKFDEKLFNKVQRRPVPEKKKTIGYYAASATVGGWFAMWGYVILTKMQ